MCDVILSIETNEDYYTDQEEDIALIPELTETISRKAEEWMEENHPEVSFETRFVPETMSYNNKSQPRDEYDEFYEVLESLNHYIEINWVDWWSELA